MTGGKLVYKGKDTFFTCVAYHPKAFVRPHPIYQLNILTTVIGGILDFYFFGECYKCLVRKSEHGYSWVLMCVRFAAGPTPDDVIDQYTAVSHVYQGP